MIGLFALALRFELLDAADRAILPALALVCHAIEALCGLYAMCFAWAAARYIWVWRRTKHFAISRCGDVAIEGAPAPAFKSPDHPLALSIQQSAPPLAIIYLCCNDLEEPALQSLSQLRYPGQLTRIVHDDSLKPAENQRVDQAVRRLAIASESGAAAVDWRVLRRPHKTGGKPGATQYVLEQTAQEHEFFLLADNDSYACDPEVLTKAMESFADPEVAAVQFRNRARVKDEDGPFAACLAGAIDIFDAFMTGLYDGLWKPFVGHNGMLRTQAVMDAGGFTPGFFADDIDLTVRLNLLGRRVAYRRDLSMEECHPSNYRSFCLRSSKWAQGCAQIIRVHLLKVLMSRAMSLRQKIGFLLFTGFYVAQAAMLAYVVLVFLALPLLVSTRWTAQWWAFGLGTAVPIAIFLPVAAYLRTEGRRLPFFRTLACCAAAYGSTDLWTMLGLARGFRRGERRWIPTNSVLGRGGRGDWWRDWAHFLFGASFLLVPLWRQPQLLLFPLTWVFAAKYLFVPAVAAHYAGIKAAPRWTPMRPLRWAQALTVWALLAGGVAAIILAPTVLGRHSSSPARVELRDGSICVDGQPTIIRGIHYSPWRPGTGPGKGFDYPSDAEIAADFSLIHSLHANTVLVYDPPARLLDLAQRQNLQVICVFHIQWWRLASGQGELIANEIIEQVQQLQAKPSVLAWMLGNEIPGWVIDKLQPQAVREFLSSTRTRIRAVDLSHPVCHGNWPLARTFDLDRDMDLLCYNVYPFYPTEVIASGYGRFIEREIKPQAHGRPLLITEFGTNTTEVPAAEQGEVLKRCWRDLLSAGCQGGVVFEFADEWWKNYDNPVSPPDWWRRQDAPDDHLTEDADPEEHYGIVTAQREPKPAFATVQEMFAGAVGASRSSAQSSLWWIGSGAAFLLIGAALWMRWKMPHAVHPQGGVVSGGTP